MRRWQDDARVILYGPLKTLTLGELVEVLPSSTTEDRHAQTTEDHRLYGPSGAYAAVDGKFLPLSDPRALVALTDSALLVGLGYSDKAAEYQKLIERRRQRPVAIPPN